MFRTVPIGGNVMMIMVRHNFIEVMHFTNVRFVTNDSTRLVSDNGCETCLRGHYTAVRNKYWLRINGSYHAAFVLRCNIYVDHGM